jgi:uncharacterized protein YggE
MESSKKWFWILLDLFVVVAIVGVLFSVMPMLQQIGNGFMPARTITVSAEGKTTATPDLAEITFSVVTQGQNPSTLSNNNNQKMSAVLEFIGSQGIATSDIATTNYNLQPAYQWDNGTQRNFITGYTLTQTVEVKVRNISKVASVLGGLAPLGVNQVGGVDFTFADQNTVVAAARADAFTQALAKAKDMASEAGVSLGKVVNVSENNYLPMPQPVYGVSSPMSIGAMAVAPSIQPGTQDITDTVTITYQLN